MKLASPDFTDNSSLPKKFTVDGSGINPSLEIGDIPAEAQSLVLIMDDPDAVGGNFTHWLVACPHYLYHFLRQNNCVFRPSWFNSFRSRRLVIKRTVRSLGI
ncbi:MAG: hypothetical protein PHH20_07890, partial [Candidatus Omnitrophica bacterium]|nr:hypothetical protein [Candidatus Omnitrophota bacterium]